MRKQKQTILQQLSTINTRFIPGLIKSQFFLFCRWIGRQQRRSKFPIPYASDLAFLIHYLSVDIVLIIDIVCLFNSSSFCLQGNQKRRETLYSNTNHTTSKLGFIFTVFAKNFTVIIIAVKQFTSAWLHFQHCQWTLHNKFCRTLSQVFHL